MPALISRARPTVVACFFLVSAASANAEWIQLTTPRLTVLSEASEARTREWLGEFNQFVDALGYVLSVDEDLLPPLTAVLFASSRDLRRYRLRTESGTTNNVGIFINNKSWSLLSLVANRGFSSVQGTTYHEAVHWYMSAVSVVRPVWYTEGMAEVFSTYEVTDDGVLWGRAIDNHILYLRSEGLEPLEQFLRSSQDQALHGRGTYYAQAWAFIHYLIFGRNEGTRQQLIQFLGGLREMGLTLAFESAFGKSFEEVGDDLNSYIRHGQYSMGRIPIEEIQGAETEFETRAAERWRVELVLGRLALRTGNIDLAGEHAHKLADLAPERAETHDLLAALAAVMDDVAAMDAAIGTALALHSTDATTHELAARRLIQQHSLGDSNPPDERFLPAAAREIADAIGLSLEVSPYDLRLYEPLVFSLLSSEQFSDLDSRLMDNGQAIYPNEGIFAVGQAAIAYGTGDRERGLRLLNSLFDESLRMSPEVRQTASYLSERWTFELLNEQVASLSEEMRFDEATALLDETLNDENLSSAMRRAVTRMRDSVVAFRRMDLARDAIIDGDIETGRQILESLAGDNNISPTLRSEARQWLNDLAQ